MNIRPSGQLHTQPILPGLSAALAEMPTLVQTEAELDLGAIVFCIHPEAAFYRLSPESVMRLRQSIADRIGGQLRERDRLYGIGVWEWLVVLPGLRSSATLTMAMIKLKQRFSESGLHVDGIDLRFGISCGAAIHPDDGEDALHLVQSAQIAALYARQSDEGSALYDRGMEDVDGQMQAFDNELRKAFSSDNGLHLYLQPQVEALGGKCIGAEALLRWRRADAAWVPPPVILAAIERLGLRHRFNRWLFLVAGQICQKLKHADVDARLSINISANDLLDPEVPELVEQALKTWKVEPSAIRIEITETSMVQSTDVVNSVLLRLRELGISLSVDDFGTGFSSMSNLKSLPVQEVKIDQSFIRNIVSSKRDQEITGSMIRLSHRLGLKVVAEGVETPETATLLAELGCEWLQGYLFSPAMPLEQFILWYQQRKNTVLSSGNS